MKKGDKVIFLGCSEEQKNWGGNDDPLSAGLTIGGQYIISRVEIHSWHTKIWIEGFKEKKFNSVCFRKI